MDIVNTWVPDLPDTYWEHIEHFVRETVRESVAATPYKAQDLLANATKLTLWSWQTAGLPLEGRTIYGLANIDRFVAVGLPNYTPAGRGNIRSQLLRIAEVLLDEHLVQHRLRPLPPADAAKPYKPNEMVALRGWARAQTTPQRRVNGAVLLAFGFGAGLSAQEIGDVRVGDIVVDGDDVLVDIRLGRPRIVPVLWTWDAALRERVRTSPPDSWAFRENHTINYANLISNFVARSGTWDVLPQTQRMRSTWLVHHMAVGTPVVTLMRAAGVQSLEALTRYVKFVPAAESSLERAFLTGTVNATSNSPHARQAESGCPA